MQYLVRIKHHTFRLVLCIIILVSSVSCEKETEEEEILFRLLEEDVVLESQEGLNALPASRIIAP